MHTYTNFCTHSLSFYWIFWWENKTETQNRMTRFQNIWCNRKLSKFYQFLLLLLQCQNMIPKQQLKSNIILSTQHWNVPIKIGPLVCVHWVIRLIDVPDRAVYSKHICVWKFSKFNLFSMTYFLLCTQNTYLILSYEIEEVLVY